MLLDTILAWIFFIVNAKNPGNVAQEMCSVFVSFGVFCRQNVVDSIGIPKLRFHDLLALATIQGSIVPVDTRTTPANMAMAGVVESSPGQFHTRVAVSMGTSQEKEAPILLTYVWEHSTQTDGYCYVLVSKSHVGALRMHMDGGYCGDGIHHQYAHILQGA